jgi:hypothetical protein
MNEANFLSLKVKAEEVARIFSNPDRQFNYNQEVFSVHEIKPLSDSTAVVFLKKDTGLFSLVFFYYIKANDGYWAYFFPTDSHVLGMNNVSVFKSEVELMNADVRNSKGGL